MKQKEETTVSGAQADRSAMIILLITAVIVLMGLASLLGAVLITNVLKYFYEKFQ